MKLRKLLLLLPLLMALEARPASAQIDRVVMEVFEIDCLPCAATIQYEVKKLPGVERAVISMEKQLVAVTYKPDAHFDAAALREAIKKAEVRIEAFHLAIRGKLEEEDGKKIFVSNGDRFVVTDGPPDMPLDTDIGIMAVVDDSTTPYSLAVDDYKVHPDGGAPPSQAVPPSQSAPPAEAAPASPEAAPASSAPAPDAAPAQQDAPAADPPQVSSN